MRKATQIISVSLDQETVKCLEEAERDLNFASRSDAIRAAVKLLWSDAASRKKLSGKIKAVIVATHHQKREDKLNQPAHHFDDIIETQLHSNLSSSNCLELFIVDGDSQRVRDFLRAIQSQKPDKINIFFP
ncbi:MAG: ribbon-helix-helix protein, CopG family [Candidatus Micrarchaeota archaeon]|nr:ribbon-helix-helix protein, CopG family [Candidatus Micrarchaeota archaeon]